MSERLTTLPEGFTLHPGQRRSSTTVAPWVRASCRSTGAWPRTSPTPRCSCRAFGVRISGEDRRCGTFFHRHAALHDQNRENWSHGTYHPLAEPARKTGAASSATTRCCPKKPCFAFDYGYATAKPVRAGGLGRPVRRFRQRCQVVIDQFIAPAKPNGAVPAA